MATDNNISLYKGDTYIGFGVECLLNGSPFDLTGASIKMEIRQKEKTGTVMKTLTDTDGITVTDAENGEFDVDKFAFTFDANYVYYYDIQVTDIDDDIRTFVKGFIQAEQDVTT